MARKNKNAGQNPEKKHSLFSGKKLDKATRARIEKQLAESRERDIKAMQEKNRRLAEKREERRIKKLRSDPEAKARRKDNTWRRLARMKRAELLSKYPSLWEVMENAKEIVDENGHLKITKEQKEAFLDEKRPLGVSDEDWEALKETIGQGWISHGLYRTLAENVSEEQMARIRMMASSDVEEYFQYIESSDLGEDPFSKAVSEGWDPLEDDDDYFKDIDKEIQEYIDDYITSLGKK